MSTNLPGHRRGTALGLSPEELTDRLKERIYGAFACLTTLLVLAGDPSGETEHRAWEALGDVAIALVSLWLATLFAELLAHMAVHGSVAHGREWVVMVRSSWQIVAAGLLPMTLLLLAGVGILGYEIALRVSVVLVIAFLGLSAMLAARRTDLPQWKRLALSTLLMGIGGVVVLLKLLAH